MSNMSGEYTTKMDNIGDLIEVKKFKEYCKYGDFIDDDGFGYAAKDGLVDENTTIYPSNRSEIPKDATHIVWYNK